MPLFITEFRAKAGERRTGCHVQPRGSAHKDLGAGVGQVHRSLDGFGGGEYVPSGLTDPRLYVFAPDQSCVVRTDGTAWSTGLPCRERRTRTSAGRSRPS